MALLVALLAVLLCGAPAQSLPIAGEVTPAAPSLTLPSIAVPGPGYILSFDLAFEQILAGAETTALNPLGLMDSFRISLTDVSGQLHFDVITLDAIERYDVAAGFGIALSETSFLMGEIGEAPGVAGAHVELNAGGVSLTTSFTGPGEIQITLDYFNELDGFGGTGRLDNVVLVPEPGTGLLFAWGLVLAGLATDPRRARGRSPGDSGVRERLRWRSLAEGPGSDGADLNNPFINSQV